MITVSFPGIGIDNFTLNPVAFTLGKIEVRWYGIIITLGIILAFSYCAYRAKQEKISFDDLLDIAIFTVIFGIIGARLYYVLTSLDKYDSFYSMIAIWEGGLAIYGGLIAGALTIFIICRHKKIKVMKMFDAVAPGVMIAQALGRWGNFFNGEAHGELVSESSPLYFIRMGLSPHYIDGKVIHSMGYVHPTFLYESLWNIVGFVLINVFYKKKKFDGQMFYTYIAWYGFGRMLIEALRTDYLDVGVFRISQVVGFLCFVVGTLMLILNLIKSRRERLTAMDYSPAYPKFVTTASAAEETEQAVEVETSEQADTDADSGQADVPAQEDTADEEHTDVSEKLGRIFNIDTDKKD